MDALQNAWTNLFELVTPTGKEGGEATALLKTGSLSGITDTEMNALKSLARSTKGFAKDLVSRKSSESDIQPTRAVTFDSSVSSESQPEDLSQVRANVA